MWSSSGQVTKTAATIILGSVCFSTFAELPQSLDIDCSVQSEKSGTAWPYVVMGQDSELLDAPKIDATGVSSIVKRAKILLGLPNKDIADVFLLSRQTIHTYLKGSDKKHVVNQQTKERSLEVLQVLETLGNVFPRSPGAMAKNYTMGGVSLLDLLSSKDLDFKRIEGLSIILAEKLSTANSESDLVNENTLFDFTRSV